MAFDKTIQTYIFDGDPNGRMMCELSNWNGRVYKVARIELAEFKKRKDAEHTGVYFLFGKDEDNNDTVYIGEAEHIYTRLQQHLKDDEYWNDCVVVISKDNLLNKAHIKYLENQFYNLAKEASRFSIINSTVPTRSSVSEYDEAMLEEFISNTKLLVNALGYKVFETVKSTMSKRRKAENEFFISSKDARAKGTPVADGFAVLKDSVMANATVPSCPSGILKLRDKLKYDGVLDEHNVFTRDYIFSSPSTAASVVLGRSANGRVEWKTAKHKTLKDFEEINLK